MADRALLFSLKVVTVQAINFSTLLALSCDKTATFENAYKTFHYFRNV